MPTQRRNNNSNILQQRAYTDLYYHVKHGYTQSVANDLLYSGAPIDEAILKLAITKKHPNIIKMLLANIQANESITETDKQALYKTAIDTATQTKDPQITTMVLQLVGNRVKPTRTQQLHQMITDKQNTATSKDNHWHIMRTQQILHQAIIEDNVTKIKTILAAGVPIDTTALRIAVTNGNQNIVAMLLTNIQNADQTKISQVIKQKLYTYAAQVAINNHDIATLGIILQFNPSHRFQINLTPILLNILDYWDITTITAFLNDKKYFDDDIKKQLLYMLTYKFLAKNNKKYREILIKLLNDIEDISLKAYVLNLAKANNNQYDPTYNQIIEVFSKHMRNIQPNEIHHGISLSDEFLKQLKTDDTSVHFQDYALIEFIEDPVCFINSQTTDDIIMDSKTANTLFEIAAKESTENMRSLNTLTNLLNSNSRGGIKQGIDFLHSDLSLQQLINKQGAPLLGNSPIQDILYFNLEKLKDLFENLGLIDDWKKLHYADQNTKNLYILSVLNILIEYVKGITIKLSTQVSNQHRQPIRLENKRSARVFMDVYLLAMDIFRTNQKEEYNKLRATIEHKTELEVAIKNLTSLDENGEVSSRYQKATKALQLCAKYSGKSITTEELKQLITVSGLTYDQLQRLKSWGIITITLPDKATLNAVSPSSVLPPPSVTPRQRRPNNSR